MRGAVDMKAELLAISEGQGKAVCLDGIWIDVVDEQQACQRILSDLADGTGGTVVTVNIDHMVRCRRDPVYRGLVDRAELVVADGMPLVWASRLQGMALPERVAGSSLTLTLVLPSLSKVSRCFCWVVTQALQKSGRILAERFCGLRIAGVYCPPFGFEQDQTAMQRIRAALSATRPDVVMSRLGRPSKNGLLISCGSSSRICRRPGGWGSGSA